MFEGMNSFALLAIPLYTFAGFTMSKGGISKRLMDFCYSIVGHIYGGLAHVNVLSSMIFAGISGSAVADTAGVSGMFMPEMVRKGYSKNFTVAVTAISSTIGIIIPPSIPMVVIAGICGISTGKLFLGGIIPGILCGLAQMIVSYFMAKKEGVPKEPGHFTIGPVLHGLWESWPALLMPIIIVGTIKYIPFASRSSLNSMLQLSGEIEEAAIIQDIPWSKRMTRIIIPIQKSSIISGYLLPFMTCLRELSLFMLLCVQGFILSTTLDYFDEMGLYAFSSGINLILIITILVCNTLVNKVTGASLDKGIGG